MVESLRIHNLHLLQARVVNALIRQGSASQIELAKGLHIKPSTVSNVVKKMERQKLITRSPNKNDDRALRICLTKKGLRASEHIREIFDRIEDKVVSLIPDEDVESIELFLEKLRDELGGKAPTI